MAEQSEQQHSARLKSGTQSRDPVQLPARMVDVAEAAGVSVATVSNVLHRPDIVALRTRAKVQAAVRALNYTSGKHAAAPQTKQRLRRSKPNANAAPLTARERLEPNPAKSSAHISPYFTPIQAAQVRAALQAAGPREGYSSVSDLVVAATMEEVKRLQRKYNDGRSWTGVPPGMIRRGRPTRGEVLRREDRQ